MRLSFIFFILLGTVALGANRFTPPNHAGRSAWRHPKEDFRITLKRNRNNAQRLRPWDTSEDPNAVEMSKPLEEVDFSQVPTVPSPEKLYQVFAQVRDQRFIEDKPDFPRRSSWLYPHDGCWARAALVIQRMEKWQVPVAWKVFVFGNLEVKTPYAVEGSVNWWYHVVPMYKTTDGRIFVIDPAIESSEPLDIRDWAKRMSDEPATLKFSACVPHSFDPFSSCLKADASTDQEAMDTQKQYLEIEWDNLVSLNMDPVKLLGNEPPWKMTNPRDFFKRARSRHH